MFSIAVEPSYSASVKGELAGGVPVEFDAVFRRFTLTEFEALRTEIRDKALTDGQVVRRVLVGWSKVVDADGAQLPFNDAALAVVLDIAGVQDLIVETFFESFAGARRKN